MCASTARATGGGRARCGTRRCACYAVSWTKAEDRSNDASHHAACLPAQHSGASPRSRRGGQRDSRVTRTRQPGDDESVRGNHRAHERGRDEVVRAADRRSRSRESRVARRRCLAQMAGLFVAATLAQDSTFRDEPRRASSETRRRLHRDVRRQQDQYRVYGRCWRSFTVSRRILARRSNSGPMRALNAAMSGPTTLSGTSPWYTMAS